MCDFQQQQRFGGQVSLEVTDTQTCASSGSRTWIPKGRRALSTPSLPSANPAKGAPAGTFWGGGDA